MHLATIKIGTKERVGMQISTGIIRVKESNKVWEEELIALLQAEQWDEYKLDINKAARNTWKLW